MGELTEHEMFEWLLEQRLLHDVGALTPDKVAQLNESIPGWNPPLLDDEIAVALSSKNTDLHHAFESWWNLNNMSPEPMTYAEIRDKAARETKDEPEAMDSKGI